MPRLSVGLVGLVAAVGLSAAAICCSACDAPTPVGDTAQARTVDGNPLLDQIVAAERELAFVGCRKTVHGVPGPHRETEMKVARQGGRTLLEWEVAGRTVTRWRYRSRFPWFDEPERLLGNYEVEAVPGETPAVAGRATRRVRLAPRHDGRPTLDLLIDAETSLVLREELRDHAGKVCLTSWFETVEYGPPATFPEAAESLGAAPEAPDPGFEGLHVGFVPTGFAKVRTRRGCSGGIREYWSDGLASFVVEQKPADEAAVEADEGRILRCERQGRVSLEGVLEGMQVRVTGYLAPAELEAVVRGLRVNGPARADR